MFHFDRRLSAFLLLFVFFIALLIVAPVAAQNSTEEPSLVVTVVAPPVEVPAAPTFINAENGMSVSTILYGVIIAILSGGTVAVVITRFGSNRANLDAMEKLYQSQSPEAQARERELFLSLRELTLRVIDIVDKVTDGAANTDSPPQLE